MSIETLKEGDKVLSRSDDTQAVGYKNVLSLQITPDVVIYKVTVSNDAGESDEIYTTAEHPFWVQEHGWLKAELLQTGMPLQDEHSRSITVQSVSKTERTETVYNIAVEDWHTYFVGQFAVWVHNVCMLGANGTRLDSKTVWKETGSKARIDVENPAPGQRPGQVHYQDVNNNKYLYDPDKKMFFVGSSSTPAPKAIQNLLNNPNFANGINKALRYLGKK